MAKQRKQTKDALPSASVIVSVHSYDDGKTWTKGAAILLKNSANLGFGGLGKKPATELALLALRHIVLDTPEPPGSCKLASRSGKRRDTSE